MKSASCDSDGTRSAETEGLRSLETAKRGPIGHRTYIGHSKFTHRIHYGAPKARGHRQFIGDKR
jgi:hypothetical protein